MEKIKSNYLYIKGIYIFDYLIINFITYFSLTFNLLLVLDIRTNENFSNNNSKIKNSKIYLNKDSQKFLLNLSIRNIETNNKIHLNNDPISFEFKENRYVLKDSLNMTVYE